MSLMYSVSTKFDIGLSSRMVFISLLSLMMGFVEGFMSWLVLALS